MLLPDNVEEYVARLPYWIGGYDIEAHVSSTMCIPLIVESNMICRNGEHSASGT